MHVKKIDGLTCVLGAEHDFRWLRACGRVVVVCDQQDSGNICFGLADGERLRFIKYAGAQPVGYGGDSLAAIARLRQTPPVYQALAHPNLVKLGEHGERGAGYACVYEWADGECLPAHWDFDAHPKHIHPQSPTYRFKRLSLDSKLACLDVIYQFHLLVAARGYVAIYFYDGSIMYDFAAHQTTLCDIDFYQARPLTNSMGRWWGSSRFMAPEEFELGATIDEVTNVYTMGATAFELLGSGRARSVTAWGGPAALFCVAAQATRAERGARFPSIRVFYDEWRRALGQGV